MTEVTAELRQQIDAPQVRVARAISAQAHMTRRVNTQLVRIVLTMLIRQGIVLKADVREFLEATLHNTGDRCGHLGVRETSAEIEFLLHALDTDCGGPKGKPAERRRQLRVVPR